MAAICAIRSQVSVCGTNRARSTLPLICYQALPTQRDESARLRLSVSALAFGMVCCGDGKRRLRTSCALIGTPRSACAPISA